MRLLLAEDEAALSRALKTLLENEGYEVHIANDGIEALQLVEEHIYDIMILDIMMPRLDGISTLKKIREMQISTPAIFLTAKGEVEDRVSGLEVGADDYLCKPFAIKELMARLHALHRRNNQKGCIEKGNIRLDMEKEELICHNSIRLSSRECRLLSYLMTHQKEISIDELSKQLTCDHTRIRVYMSYLNNKLKAVGSSFIVEREDGYYKLKEG